MRQLGLHRIGIMSAEPARSEYQKQAGDAKILFIKRLLLRASFHLAPGVTLTMAADAADRVLGCHGYHRGMTSPFGFPL